MWMHPKTGERLSLIVDEVKEYEGFQKTAKVGRGHQACDRPVTLSAGPSGDAGKRTLRHDGFGLRTSGGFFAGFFFRHGLAFFSSLFMFLGCAFMSCSTS